MMQSSTGKQSGIPKRLACLMAGGLFVLACVFVLALPATAWATVYQCGVLNVTTDGTKGTDFDFVLNNPSDGGGTLTVKTKVPLTVSGDPNGSANSIMVIDLADSSQTADVTVSNINFRPQAGAAIEVKSGGLNLQANYLDIVSAEGFAGIQNNGNPLCITGGTSLTIQGGEGGAGIGGGKDQPNTKDITIEMKKGQNGHTTIKGGKGAAGIGGGVGGSASNIVIGKWAALADYSNVNTYGIYGGEGAAGIGGGLGGYGGTSDYPLIIKDSAVVKVTGGIGGAGIGGGAKIEGVDTLDSHIKIQGVPADGVSKTEWLRVTAHGGEGAAGIGGGKGLGAGSVVISGVQDERYAYDDARDCVWVHGGSGGAAIGGGESGIGQGIKIESGFVKMEGGLDAKGNANAVSMGDGAGVVRPAGSSFLVNEISGGYIYGTSNSYNKMFTENTLGSNVTKLTGGTYRVNSSYEGYNTGETSNEECDKGWPKNSVFNMPAAEGYATSGTWQQPLAPLHINISAESKLELKTGEQAKKAYSGSALLPEDVVAKAERVHPFGRTEEDVNMSTDISFSYRLKTSTGAYSVGLPTDVGTYSVKAHLAKSVITKLTDDPQYPAYYTPVERTTEFTIEKSPVVFEGGVKTYKNGTESTSFVYGDTITVKAKPKAVTSLAGRTFTAPIKNQMALFFEDNQISAAVDVGSDGFYTMTYDTKIAAVSLGADKELTVKYVGTEILADAEANVAVDIGKAPMTSPLTSGILKVKNCRASTYTFDLSSLLPTLGNGMTLGAASYQLGTIDLGDYYDEDTGGASIAGALLTLPIEAVQEFDEKKIGTVKTIVSTDNFEDFTVEITVNAVNGDPLFGAPTLSKSSLTYGERISNITLSGSLKNDGGQEVPGTFVWSTPDALPGAGSCRAEWVYTPNDLSMYARTVGASYIPVAQRRVAIEWANYSDRLYGDNKVVTATIRPGYLLGGDTASVVVENGAQKDAGTYTATAVSLSGTDAGNYALPPNETMEYTIKRAGAVIKESDIELEDEKGNPIEKGAAVSYGTGIAIRVKPTPTDQPAFATLSLSDSTEPVANQMALYFNGEQVSEPVDADENGVYPMIYDTSTGIIPVGSKAALVARYTAGNMAEVQANIELTVAPKVIGLEWSGITDRFEGDGKRVVAKATELVAEDSVVVVVQGGDASTVGTHTATATELTGEHAYKYQLPENASVQFSVAVNPLPQPDPTPIDPSGGTGGAGGLGGTKPLASVGDNTTPMAFSALTFLLISLALVLANYRHSTKK